MNLDYSSNRLEKQCTVRKEMNKAFDQPTARSLERRIKELESAQRASDLLQGPGRWEVLTQDLAGLMSARLSANDRLIVRPVVEEDPATGQDKPLLEATDVVVIEVRDYHRK